MSSSTHFDNSQMNPFFKAVSYFRRRQYPASIQICTALLKENPLDQAAWLLKCRAITLESWIDDLEWDDEELADVFLEGNARETTPRPATSIRNSLTSNSHFPQSSTGAQHSKSSANNSLPDQCIRPRSTTGVSLSGFLRPGTGARPATLTKSRNVQSRALQSSCMRQTTSSRPLTSVGRWLRLGTASLRDAQKGGADGEFIQISTLNMRKFARKPALAKTLSDYLLYHLRQPRMALELATLVMEEKKDSAHFWWKQRLGKSYYQLGLYREAEEQFLNCLQGGPSLSIWLQLAMVYIKLDQPNTAIHHLQRALEKHPGQVCILQRLARTYELLHDPESLQMYKCVLQLDTINAEALACLASHHFYTDQPEVALRFYQRLLQIGVSNPEIWNNLGLCCFYSGQYDLTFTCFERALMLARDAILADIWYNIGLIAISIGDQTMAYQAFKISLSANPSSPESLNNLGVLELHKGNTQQAIAHFKDSQRLGDYLYEPSHNAALAAFRKGDFENSFQLTKEALRVREAGSNGLHTINVLYLSRPHRRERLTEKVERIFLSALTSNELEKKVQLLFAEDKDGAQFSN